MFSRVRKGFPPLRTPTEKHAKKNSSLSCPSVTDADGSLGPRALRSCPLLLEVHGGRTVLDERKAERKIYSDLRPACVCVCVSCVASIKSTCVLCSVLLCLCAVVFVCCCVCVLLCLCAVVSVCCCVCVLLCLCALVSVCSCVCALLCLCAREIGR